MRADFYPSRNHPYLDWALRNRNRVEIGGHGVWLAPPEYVILWKLDFLREGAGDKHARDIRGMLDLSGSILDNELVERAASELGLVEQWRALG